MPHPINAPRFRVVKTAEGMCVGVCSTDGMTWFCVGLAHDEPSEPIQFCEWLAEQAAHPVPAGEIVWLDDGKPLDERPAS